MEKFTIQSLTKKTVMWDIIWVDDEYDDDDDDDNDD